MSAAPVAPDAGTTEAELTAIGKRARRRHLGMVWLGRAIFAAVVVGGWQLSTTITVGRDAAGKPAALVDPFFFGQPSGIWTNLTHWIANGSDIGSFWLQVWTTMYEAVLGFGLGVSLGVVLGITLGTNRYLAEVLGPFIKIVNAIPRIVLGSIFVVAFGLGPFPKVLLAGVLVFFIVFFNAFQGVREVDPNVVSNVRVLGAGRLDVIRHATLPSALTWIIASLHSAFGFAIVGALVGEVLGSQHGIGLYIKTSQNTFDPNGVFAGMIVIAILVLFAEWIIGRVEHRLLSWRPPSASESSGI